MAGMNVNTRGDSELHLVPRRDTSAKFFPALRLATTSTLTDPWVCKYQGVTTSMQPAWFGIKPCETVLSYRTGSAYDAENDPLFMADTYGEFRRAVIDEGVPKSDYDNGHPFVSRSIYLSPAKTFSHAQDGESATFSPVPYFPLDAYKAWRDIEVSSSTRSNLDAWGTDAFNKVVPTKPQMSVTNFLGELVKDGFPSLVGLAMGKSLFSTQKGGPTVFGKQGASKALAKEHLNYQFAVKPLLADLKSFYKTVRDFNSILDQYERDSGRLVRRQRYEERPIEQSVGQRIESLAVAYAFNASQRRMPRFVRQTCSVNYEVTRYTSYSFSGGFMYYVPTDPGLRNNLARIESNLTKLFGAPLSPEVVWNLTPWTWLSDWLANVGTILGNYQALQTDDLVLKYGYVTRRTVQEIRMDTEFGIQETPVKTTKHRAGTFLQVAETIRQPATPFGFGLSMDSFDPRQWSILAALGFTLGPQAFKKSS